MNTTQIAEDYFRTDTKFRFSAEFVAYCVAHPQPKPILRLHCPHNPKLMLAVKANLSAEYLRNKCPHFAADLLLVRGNLIKMTNPPTNYYKKKIIAAAAFAKIFNKTKKTNDAARLAQIAPVKYNGVKIGDHEVVPHAAEGYGATVRHNPQGAYPDHYNPTKNDGHEQRLPDYIIKQILRMRPHPLGANFRQSIREYGAHREEVAARNAGGTELFAHLANTPVINVLPFKIFVKMDQRRKVLNKKRRKQIKKMLRAVCADTLGTHMPDAGNVPLGGIVGKDDFADCPFQQDPAKHLGRFLNAQDRFAHTRIALLYEERRQLIAKGLISARVVKNDLATSRFADHNHAASCLKLLTYFDINDLYDPAHKFCGPGTGAAGAHRRLKDCDLIEQGCRTQRGRGRTHQYPNALNFTVANNTPFSPHNNNTIRTYNAKVCEHSVAGGITRKALLAMPHAITLIQALYWNDSVLGDICQLPAGSRTPAKWKKCVPFIITRLKYMDAKCCRVHYTEAQYMFNPENLVKRGANPRGITTRHADMASNLYDDYFIGNALPTSASLQEVKVRAIIRTEIAIFKIWQIYNRSYPEAPASTRRFVGEFKNRYLAPLIDTANEEAWVNRTNGDFTAQDEEIVWVRGAYLYEVKENKPRYGGDGMGWIGNKNASADLQLPYLAHEGADGVRYAELDYAVSSNDLIKRFAFDENPRRRRDSVCLIAQTFAEHPFALDGGNALKRGWDADTARPNGERQGLMTQAFAQQGGNYRRNGKYPYGVVRDQRRNGPYCLEDTTLPWL
jgi:hypothetical protein